MKKYFLARLNISPDKKPSFIPLYIAEICSTFNSSLKSLAWVRRPKVSILCLLCICHILVKTTVFKNVVSNEATFKLTRHEVTISKSISFNEVTVFESAFFEDAPIKASQSEKAVLEGYVVQFRERKISLGETCSSETTMPKFRVRKINIFEIIPLWKVNILLGLLETSEITIVIIPWKFKFAMFRKSHGGENPPPLLSEFSPRYMNVTLSRLRYLSIAL